MASTGYPKVTLKAWRDLRSRAADAPSTKFTPSTVAALMGMANPKSALNNTVSPVRRLGLIDDDGALTARGNKWRIDASYAAACDEILAEVYPSELSALVDGTGAPDQQLVKTWFDHKGFGASNSRQMAATYVMIATKQVPEVAPTQARNATTRKPSAGKVDSAAPRVSASDGTQAHATPEWPTPTSGVGPNVHLDIQIHIPADASADQIDQIFASMARHLYTR